MILQDLEDKFVSISYRLIGEALSDKKVLVTGRTDLKSPPSPRPGVLSSAAGSLLLQKQHRPPLHSMSCDLACPGSTLVQGGVFVDKKKGFMMIALKKSTTDHVTGTALPEKSLEIKT